MLVGRFECGILLETNRWEDELTYFFIWTTLNRKGWLLRERGAHFQFASLLLYCNILLTVLPCSLAHTNHPLHSPASYSWFRNQPPDISDCADQNGGQTVIITKYIVLKGLSGVIWENLLKMCLSKKAPDIPAILQGSTLFLFLCYVDGAAWPYDEWTVFKKAGGSALPYQPWWLYSMKS